MSSAEIFKFHLIQLAEVVNVKPAPGGLPGFGVAQKLINGAAAFALLACIAAFLWGAAQWGIGSRAGNYSQASDGKARMLTGLGGAFAIGAATAIINFFFDAGEQVR